MMHTVEIGVINVLDPSTGFPSAPVAAVAWSDTRVWLDWVPADTLAQTLKFETLSRYSETEQASWMSEHLEHPTIGAKIDLVSELDQVDEEQIVAAVRELLCTVIVTAY